MFPVAIPVEWIEYEGRESGEYGISVRSEDARPRRLKIWSLNHDFEEYSVAENSIGSPADARGAMSVGAIFHRADYWNVLVGLKSIARVVPLPMDASSQTSSPLLEYRRFLMDRTSFFMGEPPLLRLTSLARRP